MLKLRLGMVGGGEGAFIGGVHRMAARIDGRFDLVAGALSSTPEKSERSALALGIERSYGNYTEMAKAEAHREDGIDAVSIVTPNHMHIPVAQAFLEQGIHVICDKPLTTNLASAQAFSQAFDPNGPLFLLTHNYTGTPMVRQAREMVARGDLGVIRLVQAEYAQDWLTEPAADDNKQAAWRTDPAKAGGGAIGDIGSHAYNLAAFVTGMTPNALAADLTSFVDGRLVDDNAHIMMRYASGAKGMLWASQVAVGHENGLRLRVYGDKGGLEWAQEDPNKLWFTKFGQPTQLLTRGGAGATEAANAVTRTPGGHPEGYLEAFATIYNEAADLIFAHKAGTPIGNSHVPTLVDAMEGMHFLDACVKSSDKNAGWVTLP